MSRRAIVDHMPDHLKFGYAAVMERVAIRERLLAAGSPDDTKLHFAVVEEYERAHANDPSYREISARNNARWAAQALARFSAGEATRGVEFTRDELEFLAEHFGGANHPLGAAIFAKVFEALNG